VLFDELLPDEAVRRAGCALQDCDLFIAIGTSGVVYPAADYVRSARVAGARTLLVNLEEHDEPNPCFQELILGRAEEVLDALVG
jgi:NAD-dependent deacetylase